MMKKKSSQRVSDSVKCLTLLELAKKIHLKSATISVLIVQTIKSVIKRKWNVTQWYTCLCLSFFVSVWDAGLNF